jgi:3-oxoacyl-[acyl-carrier-protein] synthase II
MYILNIGVIFSQGRGIHTFENAIQQGWREPEWIEIQFGDKPKRPIYPVEPPEDVKLKKLRRADKFTKIAVLAATEALSQSHIKSPEKHKIGLIVATGLGPHVSSFHLLEDILANGHKGVASTAFNNASPNAAAVSITEALCIRGPALTLTQLHLSFHYALLTASLWLEQQRCDYVLVGSVDECGETMRSVGEQTLGFAEDGKIKPFDFQSPSFVPGEGAAFFLVSQKDSESAYCQVKDFALNLPIPQTNPDLMIIDADGMTLGPSPYLASLRQDVPIANYSPIVGSMMTGSAFNLAAGALMIKKQIKFANPIQHNPNSVVIVQETENAEIQSIYMIKYDCRHNRFFFTITK